MEPHILAMFHHSLHTNLAIHIIYIVENMTYDRKWLLGWFLPTIWAEVGSVSKSFGGFYRLPSPTYMFTFLIIAIAALAAEICLVIRRVDLNWDNEDA